jgi:hypothetical protein
MRIGKNALLVLGALAHLAHRVSAFEEKVGTTDGAENDIDALNMMQKDIGDAMNIKVEGSGVESCDDPLGCESIYEINQDSEMEHQLEHYDIAFINYFEGEEAGQEYTDKVHKVYKEAVLRFRQTLRERVESGEEMLRRVRFCSVDYSVDENQ